MNWVEQKWRDLEILRKGADLAWLSLRMELDAACDTYNEKFCQKGAPKADVGLRDNECIEVTHRILVNNEEGGQAERDALLIIEFDKRSHSIRFNCDSPPAEGSYSMSVTEGGIIFLDLTGQAKSAEEISRFLLEPLLFR